MDDDITGLVRQLLLRAEITMEDVSDIMIISPTDPEALAQAITKTRSAIDFAA